MSPVGTDDTLRIRMQCSVLLLLLLLLMLLLLLLLLTPVLVCLLLLLLLLLTSVVVCGSVASGMQCLLNIPKMPMVN